ncbi:DUF7551 domain-containing protein [Halobaculum sp. D14]|uniref:DUF7551 domain-containing protein n=1 Tax=Halobaculum sp. D14 TaxID=3421642 RepID=UPI003EBBE813
MIGTTLGDIRAHIEMLATPSGEYYLVCGRFGDRPVPADGLRFDSRGTARAAAQATEQYRATLRRYDPHLPYYDVIVCQDPDDESVVQSATNAARDSAWRDRYRTDSARGAESTRVGGTRSGDPDADLYPNASRESGADRSSFVDFCHTIAAAVFETVAESDHDGVEDAVMDAYLDRAESAENPDELCLELLDSLTGELAGRLDAAAQAAVLRDAAARLPPPTETDSPLGDALERLCGVALAAEYTVDPSGTEEQDADSWTVTLSGYELGRSTRRLATLPLAVELLRRRPEATPSISDARCLDPGAAAPTWNFRLALGDDAPAGLVSAPEVSAE